MSGNLVGGVSSAYDLTFSNDARRCVNCTKSFIRLFAVERRLADGRTIDQNDYCPTCENEIAKAAKIVANQNVDAVRLAWQERVRIADEDIAMVECLRKEAFATHELASKVAKRSRQRHRGKSPCGVYRCTTKIDPVAHPDRAETHYHIGGKRESLKL